MKIRSLIQVVPVVAILLFTTTTRAQSKKDSIAIQNIVQEEITAWNKGDAVAYSLHFAEDGTFTNILGLFFTGHKEFVDRHKQIFEGLFRGTTLQYNIVSFRFIHPNVAIVETLSTVSGFLNGPPPGTHADANGRLSTRLLQVFVKEGTSWKIVAYHNVDVKPISPPATH